MFKIPLVYLNFYLRLDYISQNLCENKDKPEVLCGGKCYLEKQLDSIQENESQKPEDTPVLIKLKIEEICNTYFKLIPPNNYAVTINRVESPPSLYTFEYLNTIFHPPLHA